MRGVGQKSTPNYVRALERQIDVLSSHIKDMWPLIRRGTDAASDDGIEGVDASSGGGNGIDPAVLVTQLANKGTATARLYQRGTAGWVQLATTTTVYSWLSQTSTLPVGREIWLGWHQKADLSWIRVVLEAACITSGQSSFGSGFNSGLAGSIL